MDVQCWLCDESTKSMTDLKKHLGGPKHLKLHVVCPWCYGTARQLRVWDLKRHVDHIHKGLDLLLPGDLFIECTMFYFSLHPDVYSRVVRPTPTEHANAIVAMDAIRALVRSYPTGLSRDMDEWEQGWLLAIATPLSDERQPPRVQPSVYTSFAMRVAEVPEAYTPTHPGIHPHVAILSAAADGSQVDVVKDGQEGYRVSLSPDTIRNEDTIRKIHNSLSNLSNLLVGGTTTPAAAKVLQEMSEIVADMLDLSESCIDSVDSYVDPPIRRPVIHPVVDATAIVMPRVPSATMSQGPSDSPSVSASLSISVACESLSSVPPSARPEVPESASAAALSLLRQGVMPLLPPAPPLWSADEAVTFQGEVNSLKWPPKGWRDFSAKRKRQAYEYAAMSLDVGLSGFPESDTVLSKYNFLRLPGAQRGLSISTGHRMRFYNFAALREVALNRDTNQSLVTMMSQAAQYRDKSVDRHIRVMNTANIPLRLKWK